MVKNIKNILKKYHLKNDDIFYYGNYIAKINFSKIINKKKFNHKKIILVTATTPTKFGEGKTTTAISLNDALNNIYKKSSIVCLREPSVGPCFGIKGGATGGGLSSIYPQEEINLHFTGDLHSITTTNNLIASMIDNHVYWGNKLQINPHKIIFKRIIDINDRSLRNILITIKDNITYKTSFQITAASELMTVFCLSKDKNDFLNRVNNIVVAYDINDKPILVKDLKITNALWALMKNCFNPNVVQTLENNLAFVSGGPFANISVGFSSLISLKTAMSLSDYIITEAGFGSDLGGEKFLNILTANHQLPVKCIVLVTTVRSILSLGKNNLSIGLENLNQHIQHLLNYDLPIIVAINRFSNDQDDDLNYVCSWLKKIKINYCICDGYNQGSQGAKQLAELVIKLTNKSKIKFLYNSKQPLIDKIKIVVTKAYGATKIQYLPLAKTLLKKYNLLPFNICMCKLPTSLVNIQKGTQKIVVIKNIYVNYGAKLIIVICDNVYTMPGLPIIPNAQLWK